MIIQKNPLSAEETALLNKESELSKAVFFDIETTGLSRKTSHLYLIGAIYPENGTWQFIQWFLQKPSEEKELLEQFSEFLKSFQILIHYNGQTFDLPYVRYRSDYWQLSDPFKDMESMDLYRLLRPYQKLLNLSSMKQKDMEQFLHVQRKDQRDGKELIRIYHRYLESADREDLQLLLLHNHDDLHGMIPVYTMYTSLSVFNGNFSITNWQLQGNRLMFLLKSNYPIPFFADISVGHLHFTTRSDTLEFEIAGIQGCFRHYFSNYRDYYYLPLEDTAIHKSVGIYTDPSCRKKATADTCYTKKDGLYFFQPSSLFLPDFRRDDRRGDSYVHAEQLSSATREQLHAYVTELLQYLMKL